MASIYKRGHLYWLKYRNPITGNIHRESTAIEIQSTDGRRRALSMAAERTRDELNAPKVEPRELWQAWVPGYLEQRYADSPLTALRGKAAWAAILAYFMDKKLIAPRQIDYAAAAAYLPWRLSDKTGLRKVKHNTAVLEVKFLSVILREAVRRGFVQSNACRELEVHRISAKQKDEISAEHQKVIEEALAQDDCPKWMGEHWLILMRQGCRSTEAIVPMHEIDEIRKTIRFRIKGGKHHTAPLHADLRALAATARMEGRKTLVEPPSYAPKRWHTFFKNLNLPYSIHCTRVTAITRLLRASYTPAEVCAYIGHSEEINVIYRRLNPSDVSRLGAALGASASEPKDSESDGSQEKRHARPVLIRGSFGGRG